MATNIQPLNPYNLFVDNTGRLTRDGYNFLYNMFVRIGGSLDSLNAVYLADHTWDSPNPIGTGTPNTGVFTTLESQTLQVDLGVRNDGGGLKHARVSTGSIASSSSALVTVTWTTPFADTSYTVCASVVDSTAATNALRMVHIETVSTTNVIVRVENTSGGPLTGTLQVIAIHD